MCPDPLLPEPSGHGVRRMYTADQMREYGRARERAAYERAAQWIEGVAATDDGRLLLSQSFIAANLRALGADK